MKIYAKPYVNHEIKDFTRLGVRRSKGNICEGMEIFETYKEWCREYNTLPLSKNKLYAELENRFIKKKNSINRIIFLDVKVKWQKL